MSLFRRRKQQEPEFTGNCYVRSHTGDHHYVGRCYYSTYGGRCPIHGDVSRWLSDDFLSANELSASWPRDYEL